MAKSKSKATKKIGLKRLISQKDARLQKKKPQQQEPQVRQLQQVASSLFFKHNEALVPPYQVIVDTNFINFSIQNKLELVKAMMDCLYAKCKPCSCRCTLHYGLCHG